MLEIVNTRKQKLLLVNQGDRINIEKDVYIDVLWPNKEKLIFENPLNNNSIVCKLKYYDFSILFTGDIEEIAEKKILEEYQNSSVLNSTILKLAHHGSKTSSVEAFLERVNPLVALIGVGENNKFGHPNEEVIKRLESIRSIDL